MIGRKSVFFFVSLLLLQFAPGALNSAPSSPGSMSPMAFNLGMGSKPDIYAEENGKLHVTWKDGNAVRYRYYNGSSWQGTESPSIGGVNVWAKSPPTIWADSNGDPHIVWASENSHVWYINKVGGSWSTKYKLVEANNPSSFILRDTHIAVGSNGVRHVIWRKKDVPSGKGFIYHKKYQSGSWGSETLASDGGLTAKRPQIALGSDNALHLTWRGRGGPNNSYEVFYRKWSGGSWGGIEMATYTEPSCGEDSHVAVDNSNVPHVSWPEDKSNPQVGYMKRGGSWPNPTYLGHGEDPVIAIDDRDTRYVIWDDEYRYNDGSGWAGAQVFDSGAMTPDAYGDGQYAHTVYEKNDLIYYIALSDEGGGGGDPWITVNSPNGGENWLIGSGHNITWSSSDDITTVKLRYSTDSGSNWITLEDSTPNDGSYSWTIPNTPSTNCRVRVIDTSNNTVYDVSDSDFTISEGGGDPWITVTDPNGGENWQVASTHNITWSSSNDITTVKLRYSTDSGSNWITVEDSTPNDGSYSWTIPNTPSTNCRIRVIDTSNNTVYDVSDSDFTISTQGGGGELTLLSPNGGENLQIGSVHDITWDAPPEIVEVRLWLSTNSGSNWTLFQGRTPNDGSFSWTVTNNPSTTCRIKVQEYGNQFVNDISDGDFTISTQGGSSWITVTSPNGGENWQVASTHNITWSSSAGITNVKLRYSTDSGSSWITIEDSTPNDGSYSWTIPNTPSTNCRVRVIDTNNNTVYDVSNSDFTISTQGGGDPWITVTSPNGGETWQPGSTQLITWDSSSDIDYVRIDYSTNSGQTWIKIVSNTGNDGDRDWTVPNTQSSSCRVRVQSKEDPNVEDMSDSNFTIGEGGGGGGEITMLSPNGGENWQVGSTHNITWDAPLEIIEIRLWLSTDSGSSWTLLQGRTPNDGSFSWTVTNTPSTTCRIKVQEYGNQSVNDASDANFTISSQGGGSWITVTSPNGGETWHAGSNQTITWDASSDIVEVRLWGSINSGQNWILLQGRTPNDGSFSWTVTNTPSSNCRIKAQEYGNQAVNDASDSDFTIVGFDPEGLSLAGGSIPTAFNIWQNYPNPFNPSTQVRFDIPGVAGETVNAIVNIYNSRGKLARRLIEDSLQPGQYRIHWDGRNDDGVSLPSGIYLLYIKAGSHAETIKMVLTK